MISKEHSTRLSTATSLGAPFNASVLVAHIANSGKSFMDSGNAKELNPKLCRAPPNSLYSFNASTSLCVNASLASCNLAEFVLSALKRVKKHAMAPESIARNKSVMSFTTGTCIVCTRIRRSPSAEVYNNATECNTLACLAQLRRARDTPRAFGPRLWLVMRVNRANE